MKAVAEYERAGAVYAEDTNSIFLEPRTVEEVVKIYEGAHDEKKGEEALAQLIVLFEQPEGLPSARRAERRN